jgi:hypothetical protein
MSLPIPPAMEAGVTERLWRIEDIVALVEAKEAKVPIVKRDPYKKRAQS